MQCLFQVGSQLHHLKFDWRHEYKNSFGLDLPVSLRLGLRVIDLLAKIDTGAEFCIFERAYGEQLGLTIEDGHQQLLAVATGGRFRTFGHAVTLEFLGCSIDSVVFFAEDPGFRRNVLGRNGWLNQCRIAIVDHDQLLYVS
jgi:hypothetical protein